MEPTLWAPKLNRSWVCRGLDRNVVPPAWGRLENKCSKDVGPSLLSILHMKLTFSCKLRSPVGFVSLNHKNHCPVCHLFPTMAGLLPLVWGPGLDPQYCRKKQNRRTAQHHYNCLLENEHSPGSPPNTPTSSDSAWAPVDTVAWNHGRTTLWGGLSHSEEVIVENMPCSQGNRVSTGLGRQCSGNRESFKYA
jgi:hypothetical protein